MDINDRISRYRQDIKSDRVDMSFGEIINMYKDEEIIISPEYQRAFRWDKQRQTDFIESILLGIPFPSIFVATNSDGTWELIDGLQRVSTVLSFFGELKDENKNHLVLKPGSIVPELEGLTIETLPLDLKLTIKRTPCRVEIIQKDSHFEMRYELFKRLNTGGEGLTRQEIRNCIFRGFANYKYFSDVINECSNDATYRALVNISDDAREKMMYEELFLRFFSLYNFRAEYTEKVIEDFFSYFEIPVSPVLDQQKPTIEKLVWYRNSIAHGENSITVTQKDVETFISCITKCVDEMLSLFSTYISNLNYCKKDS